MATSNPNQNSMTDEYIRDLLECPPCRKTIDSVPVYECANGHGICKVCIKKLNKCPICRNDSAPVRSLKLENIVQKLKGIQPENVEPITAKPKWGKGSVRSYGAINGPNQVTNINHQSNTRQATPRQATPRQAMPREARRESRILMNNRINDRDVSGECNLCGYLCGFLCNVIGFCLFLAILSLSIYGLYGLIVFFLLPLVQLIFLSITCRTEIIIVHDNPICL
jgi:hypothetical protein